MKAYKIAYPIIITVALYLLLVIGVAAVVVNILILASVGPFLNATPAVTVISLICSAALTAIAALLLFRSVYRFDADSLKIVFGFFPVSIAYDAITEIKEHTVTKEIYVIYNDRKSDIPDKFSIMRMMLSTDATDEFVVLLREKNPSIVYTPFTPEVRG